MIRCPLIHNSGWRTWATWS